MQQYNLDFVREIIEQAAIVYNSKKSGILELGGGVPKNTAQQTGPLLDQILRKEHGGQDYIIQITDARPDTGGLSGATLQEGKSWGKVHDSHEDLITVYTDATIAFPILALYALSNEEPRKPKRLYKNLDKYYKSLQDSAVNVPNKFLIPLQYIKSHIYRTFISCFRHRFINFAYYRVIISIPKIGIFVCTHICSIMPTKRLKTMMMDNTFQLIFCKQLFFLFRCIFRRC